MADHSYFANLIWQIADLLRGPYRPPQYERVMLPMTVLRRFDCVLAPTKTGVLAEYERRKGGKVEGEALDLRLNRAAGQRFHNRSPLDFKKLVGDPDHIERHLVSYVNGFSRNVREIFEFFEFENEIERMREANLLYLVVSRFGSVDLHPDTEERRKGKIQLVDARKEWTAGGSEDSKRSLGDKRRHLTGRQIDAIVKRYGQQQAAGETSKVFDNEDFGYTRVTVERPLRLRYRMTIEDKARFLDACPHLLDDVQAIDRELGREPERDWNAVWSRSQSLLRSRESRWRVSEQRLFRNVFTHKDPEAEPVTSGGRHGGHEADAELRDFENVPLKDDIDAYFEREVRPHVPDAWMDRAKDKVGYEINFNRHFYKYTPPRPLEVIDAELKEAEEKIARLLREVLG